MTSPSVETSRVWTEQVKQLFPNENIQLTPNGRDIVVSGTVPTKDVAEKVISLSGAFVEKKEEVVKPAPGAVAPQQPGAVEGALR
jgi:Flp pilus assembly secretin CpaC